MPVVSAALENWSVAAPRRVITLEDLAVIRRLAAEGCDGVGGVVGFDPLIP